MNVDQETPMEADMEPNQEQTPAAGTELDLDCGPTKQCRNMVGVTFDGFGPEGTDLRTAWRDRLAAEGKLNTGGGSVRELVLGEGVPLEATGPIGTGRGQAR